MRIVFVRMKSWIGEFERVSEEKCHLQKEVNAHRAGRHTHGETLQKEHELKEIMAESLIVLGANVFHP